MTGAAQTPFPYEAFYFRAHTYKLRKYVGLNERTCLNQKPVIAVGQKVKKGEILADGAATYKGELALGRNVLVGFMAWDGYNFEDAIIISERLVKNDTYTSIHIEEFDIEIRETKLGREEFTRRFGARVSSAMFERKRSRKRLSISEYIRASNCFT